MATALAYPDSKRGRGNVDAAKSVLNTDISSAYLKHARFVLRNCRDKAIEVLRNSKYPLTVAYEEAQAIVEEQRIDEEERQRQLAALAILREKKLRKKIRSLIQRSLSTNIPTLPLPKAVMSVSPSKTRRNLARI